MNWRRAIAFRLVKGSPFWVNKMCCLAFAGRTLIASLPEDFRSSGELHEEPAMFTEVGIPMDKVKRDIPIPDIRADGQFVDIGAAGDEDAGDHGGHGPC